MIKNITNISLLGFMLKEIPFTFQRNGHFGNKEFGIIKFSDYKNINFVIRTELGAIIKAELYELDENLDIINTYNIISDIEQILQKKLIFKRSGGADIDLNENLYYICLSDTENSIKSDIFRVCKNYNNTYESGILTMPENYVITNKGYFITYK